MQRPDQPEGDKLLERISRRYEQLSEKLDELETKLQQAGPERSEEPAEVTEQRRPPKPR